MFQELLDDAIVHLSIYIRLSIISIMKKIKPPQFLLELLNARSPSGSEEEAQAVFEQWVRDTSEKYEQDVMGNCIARIHCKNKRSLMLAGHIDELGLMVKHITDDGYVYFDTIGGHDRVLISGRRVRILTENGVVHGVTGKRAIHLMDEKDRNKVPELHEIWIDLGVKTKEAAEALVSIGDVAVYDHTFEVLNGSVCTSRAFDDKSGAYVVGEVLRRVAKLKNVKTEVISVATTQEEIGTRGAITSSFAVKPDVGIAIDVGHATDSPDCDHRKYGSFTLGGGPILGRGPNIHPKVFRHLKKCADKIGIKYQIEAEPRPTPTDARSIQVAGSGVATALISLPLRYMHTPSEVMDLDDIEATVQLLCEFAKTMHDMKL